MYRFDVRADNIAGQGPVVIVEATPLAHKLVATFTREEAETALQTLGLSSKELELFMKTFADGVERIINVDTDATLLNEAGFLVHD